MSVRLVFIIGLVVLSFGAALGAPKAINSEKDFKKNLVEFLKQDADFLKELEKTAALGEISLLVRHTRQAEIDDSQVVDDIDTEQKEAGFFDRAARFVMDLLQRFLKWINTDTN